MGKCAVQRQSCLHRKVIKMGKILFLGTENACYHPMKPMGEKIAWLFCEDEVEITGETKALEYLEGQKLCILYTEFGEPKLPDKQVQALADYVKKGGCALFLHNGISLAVHEEVEEMTGGRFLMHPPYEELPLLEFSAKEETHPVIAGVSKFQIREEAYRYQLNTDPKREIFLQYEDEAGKWPAGWRRTYGAGQVYCLAFGHQAECLETEGVQRILQNICRR